MNSTRKLGLKSRLSMNKTVSKRKFVFASEDRIKKLQEIQLKKSTESKCKWAVTAYVEWRNERLRTFNYDFPIYEADIENLPNLCKDNLQYALCRFIPEVTKSRGEGPFPGGTLYQLIVALQKYLRVNKLNWDLVEGKEFSEVKTVLDNVMQERMKANIGVVKKQAELITYQCEEKMWQEGILGESDPHILRQTVLYLLGINCFLHAVNEHYYLRRPLLGKKSQLNFERNEFGDTCIVYREDFVTKTHDGELNDMNYDRKECWIFPNKTMIERCPVCLVEKYLSLCPSTYVKKDNFYLQSLQKPTPKQWYAGQVIGTHTLSKVVKNMMKQAEIEGYFTNHSARRTG